MGRSHAISGAVGWLGGCALLSVCGTEPSPGVCWAGAVASAGFALLPDIDHAGSTVSRTLGPLTRGISKAVSSLAARSQTASCGHCRTEGGDGHRGLTHTATGAFVLGLVVLAAVAFWGQRAGLAVFGFAVWLAAHTALSSRLRAKIGDLLLPGRFRHLNRAAFRFTAAVGAVLVAALAAGAVSGTVSSWWWLGLASAWGCLAHSLGDALTLSRVPLLWPLQVRGCRWTRVGAPAWMRFRTGSRVETAVVVLMAAAGLVSAWALGAAA